MITLTCATVTVLILAAGIIFGLIMAIGDRIADRRYIRRRYYTARR